MRRASLNGKGRRWKLAGLADQRETDIDQRGQGRGKDQAPCLAANYNVDFGPVACEMASEQGRT